MMLHKIVIPSLCLLLISPSMAQQNGQESTTNTTPEVEKTNTSSTPLPIEQIKNFADIFTRIKGAYIEEVTDEVLLEYAVQGMLHGLDPHSSYLKGESFDRLNESTTGRFGGLGMEVTLENGFVKVVAPIDDTPAFKAGIQSGDLIIRIDGNTVSGTSLQEATKQMRGKPGTKVTLTVLRDTTPEPFDVVLERAVVRFSSVKRKRLSDEIGYLRISEFQIATAENFRQELRQLTDNEQFSGLIIDLRNNPGGLLSSAVSIADLFIKEGVLVSTRGRKPDNRQEFKATSTDILDGKPIVVLINAGSASASEIVAGALQDHQRALILGTTSFGKGSVQTVMNINEEEAIKITTARYYTPNGTSIQATGIVPDVLVTRRQFKEQKQGVGRIKESNLPGALEKEASKNTRELKTEIQTLLASDYQLNEAFNLLTGIVLYQQN